MKTSSEDLPKILEYILDFAFIILLIYLKGKEIYLQFCKKLKLKL
jgi:hypothetical protein